MRKAGGGASVVLALLLAPSGVPAAIEPASAPSRCACDPSALLGLRDEIAAADTLARAQRLAVPPMALARSALTRARWLAPGSAGLAEKEHRLRDAERAIAAASTPEEVVRAFDTAVTGSPVFAGVAIDPPGCSYSTGEIIAIVLGFILGVIPGIILLIILC